MDRRGARPQAPETPGRRHHRRKHHSRPPLPRFERYPCQQLRRLREEAAFERCHYPPSPPSGKKRQGTGGPCQTRQLSHPRRRRATKTGDLPQRIPERYSGRLRSSVLEPARRNSHHRHARPPKILRRGKEKRRASPHFLAVINADKDPKGLIRMGHERVLRARFADAQFFWQSDQKCRLADYLPKLERVTYESRLGSYRDKVERIRAIARWLTEQWFNLGMLLAHVAEADRAAELAKCDLATEMVRELDRKSV